MAAKLVSMALVVLSVPLLLQLLGTERYGTWVTLTSLVAFVGLLDLGVGNSMRNSVATMTTEGEEVVRLEFVGFFRLLAGVGLIAALACALAAPHWGLISGQETAARLLYLPVLLLIPLLLGANVLQGARATGLQAVLQAAGSWAFFALIGVLALAGHRPEIAELAIGWSTTYVVALVVTFAASLRVLRLSPGRLLRGSVSSLPAGRLRVGLEFLVLQLSSLVLYSLGNVLVFRYLGAGEVARYDVLNKIFVVALSLYTIVIGVMWAEIAKSRADGDAQALTRTLRRLSAVSVLFSVACLLGASVAPTIVEVWTRQAIAVTRGESLAVAALVSVQSLAYVGAVFMNAFEQIRLQIAMAVLAIALMVPLTHLFMDMGLSIAAVPLAAMLLTTLPMFVCNLYAVRLVRSVRQAGEA